LVRLVGFTIETGNLYFVVLYFIILLKCTVQNHKIHLMNVAT